jgi:hypothetical protein
MSLYRVVADVVYELPARTMAERLAESHRARRVGVSFPPMNELVDQVSHGSN